jgi:hypothetical protein
VADQTEISSLIGTLRALDQWRSAEVTMQARGVHRVPDGSLYMQVEYLVEVRVPDHDAAKRLVALVDGVDVAPVEEHPVVGGESVRLWDSEPGELVADDAGAQDGEG